MFGEWLYRVTDDRIANCGQSCLTQLYCTALHCWLQVNTAQSRHSSGTGLPLFLATVTATIALLNNM